MTTQKPHNFNFFNNEFNLYDSLQNEVINMRGIEVYYLPKIYQNVDLILGEDPISKFRLSYPVIMWLASFSEFGGDGSVFGHFGLHVTDQATFEVNINEFHSKTDGLQPIEGDLIYVPMGQWLMEVFHWKQHDPFYHMGKQSKYIFETRRYEYSNETMETGIDEIDILENKQSTDVDSENTDIDNEINDILNSSEPTIFGDK
jgi:hypothetical protein